VWQAATQLGAARWLVLHIGGSRSLAPVRALARRAAGSRRWSLRWLLALANAAIAGGTLLILGLVLLALLDGALQQQLADYLRSQAVPVIERELGPQSPPVPVPRGKPAIIARPPGPLQPPSPHQPPARPLVPGVRDATRGDLSESMNPARLRQLAAVFTQELAGRDTGIVVYDPSRRVIYASDPGDRVERWPAAPREALEEAARGFEGRRVVDQVTRRTLVLLLPLRASDGAIIGVLEVAGSLELVDRLRMRLGIALGIGTVLAVLVAGALAGWTGRAGLGPLERMVLVTRRIAGGDLAARVNLRRQDEVGELAVAFDQMVERLEAAFAAQRQLVSDAAHELRTPLNGLAGTLEIVQVGLARGDLDGARRLLGSVEGELDRLGRLVNDLLTLSSLDERSPVPMAPVLLVPVLRDVVRRARILAPDHEIAARLDDAATIVGNRDQIERVFTNLLDNAVKYTPPPGRIELATRLTGSQVEVTVSDTGRGIPAEDLPYIFDRFYRADRARSRQHGGAGLGLAIVQAIVSAHGGQISAESEPGVGTTIRVRLPVAGER
jgi:signal transduction histidine kinase